MEYFVDLWVRSRTHVLLDSVKKIYAYVTSLRDTKHGDLKGGLQILYFYTKALMQDPDFCKRMALCGRGTCTLFTTTFSGVRASPCSCDAGGIALLHFPYMPSSFQPEAVRMCLCLWVLGRNKNVYVVSLVNESGLQ